MHFTKRYSHRKSLEIICDYDNGKSKELDPELTDVIKGVPLGRCDGEADLKDCYDTWTDVHQTYCTN